VTSVEDGPTVVRDARTLRPVKALGVRATAVALSPDGRTLLAGGRRGSVRFADVFSGTVRTGTSRHEVPVARVAYSHDGRLAATGGVDRRIRIWDVATGAVRETFAGHAGPIEGLAFSRDDRTLISAASDGKVLIWDLAGDRRLARPFGIRPYSLQNPVSNYLLVMPLSYALSADGGTLAVGSDDGTVRLTDVRTLRAGPTFRAFRGRPVASVGYMPDGRLLVSDLLGSAVLLDPRTGSVGRAMDGVGTPMTPSFSRDRRLMTSVVANGAVTVQTLRSGRPAGRPRVYGSSFGVNVSLSPDGRTLAVAGREVIEIVDVATLRPRLRLRGSGAAPTVVRFSPDGSALAAGGLSGWVRVWSTKTWRPASSRVQAQSAEVPQLAFSPDSRILAVGGQDGAIQLFDVSSMQPFGSPLPALPDRITAPVFTPDGNHLLVVTDGGRAYRWDVRPASWARHACDVAGRRLTRAEWNEALPGRPYKPAC
jgi:WD40 repeat protein